MLPVVPAFDPRVPEIVLMPEPVMQAKVVAPAQVVTVVRAIVLALEPVVDAVVLALEPIMLLVMTVTTRFVRRGRCRQAQQNHRTQKRGCQSLQTPLLPRA